MINTLIAIIILFIILIGILSFSYILTLYKRRHKKSLTLGIDQEIKQFKTKVKGTIPHWLNGIYVRNGPVNVQMGETFIPHWFDGLAMLHAFEFKNGQANYSNKFLRSFAYNDVFINGNLYFTGFANLAQIPLWQKFINLLNFRKHLIQNANVNVAKIAKQTVALTETPLPVSFNIKNLETLGPLVFKDNLPKKNIFESAHIQFDRRANQKINYLVKYGFESYYLVYKLNEKKLLREIITKIQVKNPSYMHSFAITENYIILVEYPMIVNPMSLMLLRKPFIKNYYWQPERGTQFLIIDRKTGETETLKTEDPFFAFHHVNAFEDNNNIILDIVTYPDANIISDIAMHDDINSPYALNPRTKLMRFTLSLERLSSEKKQINSYILFDAPIEFPKINENFNGYTYRYIYLADPRLLENENDLRPIYKFDTKTKTYLEWSEKGMLPSEPYFIPHSMQQNKEKDIENKLSHEIYQLHEEDNGVVVSIILDEQLKSAFLLILDAKNFNEITRVYAPYAIPAGLHGQFFD